MERHFHLKKGYLNDPNGLCVFNGKYHAFFQTSFGRMNPTEKPTGWGHAVSDDLVHWEQLPDAIVPDKPYEKDRGCWSGSAVVKDGRLYAFYTGAARPNASVNVAWSDDGIHFTKYEENPVICRGPADGDAWEFRDPKVQRIGDTYHMVLGNSCNGAGRVVRYTSRDLLHWDYAGVLYENGELGPMLECADFFPLGDRYVLMVSLYSRRAVMIVGSFDGEVFTPERICDPEKGCAFYAPQSFEAPDGRRLLMGWAFETQQRPGAAHIGALTAVRELRLVDGEVRSLPVRELTPYLTESDPCVRVMPDSVQLLHPDGTPFGYTWEYLHIPGYQFDGERPLRFDGNVEDVKILRDGDLLEVFINHGRCNFTAYTGIQENCTNG